ncbi:MAG: CHAT domain-containing protein [Nostocaceae cyanobacterium]|nr:CHAT domain-containing protein [Nostocaceae cyanobacterium]
MQRYFKYLILATVLLSLNVLGSCSAFKLSTPEVQPTPNRSQEEALRLQQKGLQQLSQGQFPQALADLQQVLSIFRKIKNRRGEAATLKDIGQVYDRQLNYSQALEYYRQALAISQKIADKTGEIETLAYMGLVYYKQGSSSQALDLFRDALLISRETNDKQGEAKLLQQIGSLMEVKKKPDLAILFYKQSANLIANFRQKLQISPKITQQQSYIKKFAATYRNLSNLLFKQKRILEAQTAVDSLQVQELDDYLPGVRGKAKFTQRIDLLKPEQQLVNNFDTDISEIVQLGKELSKLQKIPTTQRTPQQEQRRQELEAIQRQVLKEFLQFSESPEVLAYLQELNRTTRSENLNPKLLRRLQNNLKRFPGNPVLLYPLVLEDRLELLLVTAYTPPTHHSVSVKRQELYNTIAQLRTALTNPASDAKQPAQKLYKWLISPIEPVLAGTNAKTIIYAPDGQLRYIPLAALHNGKQWLAQKYRVNNITALSITDFNQQPQSVKILAGAFSKGNYDVKVGSRTLKYGGLPFAAKEVDNVTATFPGSTKLLNSEFTEPETTKRISNYSILHFATHAAFVTGTPENSFILFGDGKAASLNDLRLWNLSNTDLVVLSACETGLGGQLGNGIEILGFGYVMEEAGAKAAIASLWQVSDEGTQTLMNAFYAILKQEKLSKAEALQKAQMTLIPNIIYEHPYYWAGFILIGNGL